MYKFLCVVFSLTLLFVLASPVLAADQTVNGWISDSTCGAKGAHEGSADCAKKCIAAGASMVVVTDQGQKVLTVRNPDALKGHEGHHVAVTGQIEGDTINVVSAKML